MKFFYKNKILFAAFLLVLEFFIASALPVLAFPSASSIADELEKRYHLNLRSIQNQGEFFNVSDQKKMVPEASLFFSPNDPKEGEKISAKAFPIYFSNPENSLYYTWYLKRKGCELSPKKTNISLCDHNNDNRVTEEDWKIEAARTIAQNGYDKDSPLPSDIPSDGNSDGYKAKFGGENKSNVENRCYVHGQVSGINYELVESASEETFVCPGDTEPVCMVVEDDDPTECSVSGFPTCSDETPSDVPECLEGSPRCVDGALTATLCSSFSTLSSCSASTPDAANPICRHLFPNAKNKISGDGSFGDEEENLWGTNETDPDTADNGNKDEANVVGLGQQTFKWNYEAGDMVGVVVEGTSMIQSKHDESSFMTMWAFSKNDCHVPDDDYYQTRKEVKYSYTESIKGYGVKIPVTEMDLNDCLERNLVDPTQGGQATNLDVAVTAIPDNPVNDESDDKAGDTVIAQASVANAKRAPTDILFDWKISMGDKISNNSQGFIDITDDLLKAGLTGNTKGNALESIAVKMDIREDIFADNSKKNKWREFISDGIAYLRFKVDVTENFSSGIIRKGKSDVIVKFISSPKKIKAYLAEAKLDTDRIGVILPITPGKSDPICDEDVLDRSMCRIIRNEIIGLKIDPTGLSNFHWTINDTPLLCSYEFVSDDCANEEERQQYEATGKKQEIKQGEVNFFPVTGDVGDTYTVTVTANDTTTDYTDDAGSNKGDTITLTRTFHIVEPMVSIKSLDESIAWPKLLGQYKDITGATNCPGGLCNDYSTFIFQAFSNSELGFKAAFIPSFLKDISQREWRVDGEIVEETAPGEIHFTADKLSGEIYNVDLAAQVSQSTEIRRALLDIWNVSPFESTEINFATAIQTELKEQGIVQGPFQNERKYLAALVSYIPLSLLFTFRIILSAGLLLFAASFLNALLQDRRMKVFAEREF